MPESCCQPGLQSRNPASFGGSICTWTAATMAAVAVATPLMRCMKLSATRSAVRIDSALPCSVPKVVPFATRCPSAAVHATRTVGSTSANTCGRRGRTSAGAGCAGASIAARAVSCLYSSVAFAMLLQGGVTSSTTARPASTPSALAMKAAVACVPGATLQQQAEASRECVGCVPWGQQQQPSVCKTAQQQAPVPLAQHTLPAWSHRPALLRPPQAPAARRRGGRRWGAVAAGWEHAACNMHALHHVAAHHRNWTCSVDISGSIPSLVEVQRRNTAHRVL